MKTRTVKARIMKRVAVRMNKRKPHTKAGSDDLDPG
jgi:hypothetical protein